MAGRTTTVTHVDGTVSKRTSARAEYNYAAVVKTDQRAEAAKSLEQAAAAEADAAKHDAAALLAPVTEKSSPWFGGTRTTYSLAGCSAGSSITGTSHDRPRPSDDDMRAEVAATAQSLRENAENYRAHAAKLNAGPEFVYGVYRWSRTYALAQKGANEVNWLRGRSTVYVVPVDQNN